MTLINSDNKFEGECAKLLAEALETNTSLTKLDLWNIFITMFNITRQL